MAKRHLVEWDFSNDVIEPLNELADNPNLPIGRGRCTLWRWATAGVEINGTTAVLAAIPTGRGGRNLHSSVGAVRAFLMTLSRLHGQSTDHWQKKPARRIKE